MFLDKNLEQSNDSVSYNNSLVNFFLLGLVSEDIAVIEHFCYTYKHLPAEVVLTHWVMQEKRGKHLDRACTRENLLSYLEDMGRDDIINHIRASSGRENEQIQTGKDMDQLINVMETTRL